MDDFEPILLPFPKARTQEYDPVVISGIGLATSVGSSREEVWRSVQSGVSGVRRTDAHDDVGDLRLPAAMVDWLPRKKLRLKSILMAEHSADEAIRDAHIPWKSIDRYRFGCSISTHFGDISYLFGNRQELAVDESGKAAWWTQFVPSSQSTQIADRFGLYGPRMCHATACASGIVSTLAAARMLEMDQADYMLCGASDAVHYLLLAAFHRMGVLADCEEVSAACKPFDRNRNGFVMGEGAAMLVLEKRSQALQRGAPIYAEIASSQVFSQSQHVTGLDGSAETLTRLIQELNRKAGWEGKGPQYVNAHGTGTEQNDRNELLAIRSALKSKADQVLVGSNKAVLGHLINAAGSVELALTALALRDGFAPPTMHLRDPESIGAIDCLAELGVQRELDRAIKLSLAFGGHLVGIAIRRTPLEELQRSPLPLCSTARIRKAPRVNRRAA